MSPLPIPGPFPSLAAAVFLAVWLVQPRRGELRSLPWWKRWAMPVALIIGGVAGSRLPGVLASGDWVPEGRTLTAGLAVGYLMVEVVRTACMLPPGARDAVALPLSTGLVVARLGCFLNGCCRGEETSLAWAVDFGDGVRRHPIQLYETAFHLLTAGAILGLRLGGALRGEVLRLYLITYCVYRFATEWIRPEPVSWLGLTVPQIVVATFGTMLVISSELDAVCSRGLRPRRVPGPRA